jgi:hypothetical protein
MPHLFLWEKQQVFPENKIIEFEFPYLISKNVTCMWVEISSLPAPEYNGEKNLAEVLYEVSAFDYIIDVGAGQGGLKYGDLFPGAPCLMFDQSIGNMKQGNKQYIERLVGTGNDQAKLEEYLSKRRDARAFIKIDVDGSEIDVLKTIERFDGISAIQFEYDRHWSERGIELSEILDILPYDNYYAVHHSGLSLIDPLHSDNMYKNILCGELDFVDIDRRMKESKLCHIKKEVTEITEGSAALEFYNQLRRWSSKELHKGNTKKRRGKKGLPLDTFRQNGIKNED